MLKYLYYLENMKIFLKLKLLQFESYSNRKKIHSLFLLLEDYLYHFSINL